MGILQRFSDIMSANINSLLSGAEEKNAGKLLEKYLADARANLEELKSETSAIIADEMAAARRVAANNEEIAKYDRYAEQAVLAGNDDDARKFLDAKSQLVAKKAELEAAYETAKSNSDIVKKNAEWCFKLLNACDNLFSEMYREEHSIEYYKSGSVLQSR